MSNVGSAPPGPDANALERAIGGKLAVWVGAIALALGGVFLVKYSIDQGLLQPVYRVLGGVALGFALGGVAWRLRDRSNYVAQGLAAAAVIDMYAVLWAAVELYALIPPLLALVGMVGTTLFAVALSLRLGPLVAILGLIGAFLAPLLIGGEPVAAGLFAYLLALQAGGQFLAYRRRWLWVSAISLGAGSVWVLLYLLSGNVETVWPALFLLGSTVVLVMPEMLKPSAGRAGIAGVWASTAIGTLLLGHTLSASGFDPLIWAFFIMLAVATGALAVWQERFRLLPWLSFAVTGMLAAIQFGSSTLGVPESIALLGLLSLTFLGIGFAGLWRSKPREFAILAAIAPLVFLVVAMPQLYRPVENLLGESGWMYVLLTIGAVYALLALPVVPRHARLDASALVALLVPAQLYIAAAWPFGFDFRLCIGLWSAQLIGAFALERWLKAGGLRAAGIALLVALWATLLTPMGLLFLADDLPTWPLIHWASAAYLAAIVATAAARRLSEVASVRTALSISTVLLAMAGAAVNIHHAANAGDMMALKMPAIEAAMHVMVVLLAGLWLVARSPQQRLAAGEARVLQNLGVALAMIGMFIGALVLATLGNPWLMHEPVRGVIVLNSLLFGIGLPALLSGLISWQLGVKGFATERQAGWWATGALIVFGVMMQVRHAFHGAEMWRGDAVQAEHYAYSIALALLALLSLALGIRRNAKTLRVLALIGMLACSIKVFGYDMRELEGIYRVLSFLGLGASLMLLGYLYNRFGPKPPARPTMPAPNPTPRPATPEANPTARPAVAGPAPQPGPQEPDGLIPRRIHPVTPVVPKPKTELPPREEILTD